MQVRRDESGQTLILTALCMTILLGFAGLGVDIGVLFHAKRNLQIAADAAAAAGALDYLYNGSTTSAVAAGKAAATQNGVTDGSGGATVTINTPPAYGPNTGTAGFVEAIVSTPNPTFFMRIFNRSSVTIATRAVAGSTAGGPCIWLMNPSGTGLQLKGGYDIEATDCGIYVNSPDNSDVSITGNGGIVNALYLESVGNPSPQHNPSPTPLTKNAAPRSNPLRNLPDPDPSTSTGCDSTNTTATSLSGDMTGSAPGDGKTICYTQAVTLNGVTLGAGTYVFGNGVTISGTVTVNGGTLDVADGSFNQPSNTTLNLTASTIVTNPYHGISLMVPPTNSSYACNSSNPPQLQLVFGSSGAKLDGIIYAPCTQVYLQDNGGNIVATGIIAASLYDNASLIDIPNYSKVHPTTSPLLVVTLVE